MYDIEVIKLEDVCVANRRVLVRVDFNVPLDAGRITDDARVRACLPTINYLLQRDAAIILVSHLGRPTAGHFDKAFSLRPVARHLGSLLDTPVTLVNDWQDGIAVARGQVTLLENIRFCPGETSNDDTLARRLAGLCDIYVNDAFATAHRAQASTCGVAKYAPVACAGPLLVAEVAALLQALCNPRQPLLAVVGGAKVSGKLAVLTKLLEKVDVLITGGGIANTFLAASGIDIGKSLYEPALVETAARILERAEILGKDLPLPVDVVCADAISEQVTVTVRPVTEITNSDLILDIGPRSRERFAARISDAATIVWNGPVGMFELPPFSAGTRALARAIADSSAFSVAGGGDTLAAIASFGVADRINYISTGGGAFLEFLQGGKLPAIEMLEESARARQAAVRDY